LTDAENATPTIIREKEIFMKYCNSYDGNKLQVGNCTSPTVVTVDDDDDEYEEIGTFHHIRT